MSFESMFGLLLGVVFTIAVIYAANKVAPYVKALINRGKLIDLEIVAKLSTCASSVGLHKDTHGETILVFTYKDNQYAIRRNCSVAMEIAPNRWTILSTNDGIDFINAMQPRRVKQENNQNQTKQHNNNNNQSGSKDNNNGNKSNTIPNDKAEQWHQNGTTWDEKPKFAVNQPYYLCKSRVPGEEGLWIVGKSRNGHKS